MFMDIFVINTEKADFVSEELLSQFGRKEFRDKTQKKIHQFSYLMLDRILKEFYQIENREILNDKKPELKNGEKHFSLSHSGQYIVIAFSDSKCGIDIENIKQRDYKKISKRMKFNSANLKEFYQNWTKYEAKYKLGKTPKSEYEFEIPEYIITAVSGSSDERFDVYYNL